MSDLAIITLNIGATVVAVWATYLVATLKHRQAAMAVEERKAIRLEQMMERENGVVAMLRKDVAACVTRVDAMHSEQRTFLVNARAR